MHITAKTPLLHNPDTPFISLAGIKFYDCLLVGDGLNLVSSRNAHHHALERFFVQRQPNGHRAAGGGLQVFGGGMLTLRPFTFTWP